MYITKGVQLAPRTGVFRQRLTLTSCRNFCDTGSLEPPTFAEFPAELPKQFLPYRLQTSWAVSPDSKVLRLELPNGVGSLSALGAPSGVKVRREIVGHLLDKSYSPISRPEADGYMDLLVKRYPPRPGGGLGAFLCDMVPGDSVEVKLKAPRNFGASIYSANRFSQVVVIGNGTGVAPLLQLAARILENPEDHTRVHFVAAHRAESDILMRSCLDKWAVDKPGQICVHYCLSRPTDDRSWQASGHQPGRLDADFLRLRLPEPTPCTLAVACGTDGFLEAVCGDKIRVGFAKKVKLQGPVRGFLAELNFGDKGATVTRL